MTDEREVCFMDLDELKRKSVIHDKKSADEIRKQIHRNICKYRKKFLS